MSHRAQRLAALALLVMFFPSVVMATAYALRPVRKPLVVYALDSRHRVLPSGSLVKPGQHITVVATGFRARTRVQVVDISRRRIHYLHADNKGVARTAFVVPGARASQRTVALDGITGAHMRASAAVSTRSSQLRDPQSVSVSVPLLRQYSYRIRGGSGVDAGGVGVDPGTHAGEGGGTTGLADTGVDVLAALAGAALLLLLGAVAWRGGRRRDRFGGLS